MYIKLKGITPNEHRELMEIKFWNERFCDVNDRGDIVFKISDEDCFDIRYTKSKGLIFFTGLVEIGNTKSATIVFGKDVD